MLDDRRSWPTSREVASTTVYGGLFGWDVEAPTGPAPHSMVEGGQGGLWDTSGVGALTWAISYVQVPDVAAAVARAQELGGSVIHPLTDDGRIEVAHGVDSHGNRVGVWTPVG